MCQSEDNGSPYSYLNFASVIVHYTLTIVQIVAFFILTRGLISSKVVIYEQLFNPILSDSFGFTVKQTSYFFLLLLPPTIGGAFVM